MAEIIDFGALKDNSEYGGPWMTGPATCQQCGHRWVVVAPVGSVALHCSACDGWHGLFDAPVTPKEVLQCTCGEALFFVTPAGFQCRRCATVQRFE